MPTPRPRVPFLALAAAAAACAPEPEPSPAPPPGAVLRIGPGGYLAEPGWILADEVDRWVPAVALVEPEETKPSWRRKALTNIVLPLRIAALLFPDEREEARRLVEEARAILAAGGELDPDGPLRVERVQGSFRQVGLDSWGVAYENPGGDWSEVFETIGGWRTVRTIRAPEPGGWNVRAEVVVEHVTGMFLRREDDPHTLIHDARDKLGVVVVDPEWEWILPKLYQYDKP